MSETAWQALLVVTSAIVLVEGLVLIGILRHIGTGLMGSSDYADVEEGPAPGTIVELDGLPRKSPKLFTFVSPGCNLCPPLVAALPRIQRAYSELEVVAIVVGEDLESKVAYTSKMRGISSRTDLDHLLEEWSVPGTPFVVGIGQDGVVLNRGIANNLPQLEHFSEELIARNAEAMQENHDGSPEPLQIAMFNGSPEGPPIHQEGQHV